MFYGVAVLEWYSLEIFWLLCDFYRKLLKDDEGAHQAKQIELRDSGVESACN